MSEEYTPTTDMIRRAYVYERVANGMGEPLPVAEAEYDRWLEAHDREVAEKTLRDAVGAVGSGRRVPDEPEWAQWLLDRAAAIASGE